MYGVDMKRTTLMLPDDLALAIEREARRRSSSIAKVTREALQERFNPPAGGRRAVPFANLGRSDHRHTARDMEDLLDEEWGRAGRP